MIHPKLKLKPPAVRFDPKKHVYSLDDGTVYAGCSTIADAWQKVFLQYWYAKECAECAKANYEKIRKMSKKEFTIFMDYAKDEAKRKSDQAKVVGTEVHSWIQQYIENCILEGFDYPDPPIDEQAKNAVNSFIRWVSARKIEWLASELIVASHQHQIAGTLDSIAQIDEKLTLVDFKTSGRISESYLLQLAGYDIMLREMGAAVDQYIVLRIPKDGSDAETRTVGDSEELEFLKKTFLHQREAYKFYEREALKKTNGKMRVDDDA